MRRISKKTNKKDRNTAKKIYYYISNIKVRYLKEITNKQGNIKLTIFSKKQKLQETLCSLYKVYEKE